MHININVPIQSFMEMVLVLYTGWLYNKQQTMFCYRSHQVQLFGNNNNMLWNKQILLVRFLLAPLVQVV